MLYARHQISIENYCKNEENCVSDHGFCANKTQRFYALFSVENLTNNIIIWAVSSEFGTYRLCEQRRFIWACASAQPCQNRRCSFIQAVSQAEPSDRKPDPWAIWVAGHAQLNLSCRNSGRHKFAYNLWIDGLSLAQSMHHASWHMECPFAWSLTHATLVSKNNFSMQHATSLSEGDVAWKIFFRN